MRFRLLVGAIALAFATASAPALAASPRTGEIAVNAITTGLQERAAIATDADGDSVAVWQGPDAAGSGIFARRLNAAGVPQGAADIPVNTTTAGAQAFPAVATDAGGNFV